MQATQTNSATSNNNQAASIESARIAKLPSFWKDEPEVWFIQVEATFRLHGITQDSTKYEYLVANLEPSILFLVKDIILNTSLTDKYAAMKKRITDSFEESSENKIKCLLNGLELGDQKPSHYLQRMKCLAAGKVSDDVLKSLFLDRLPEKVRCILAVCDSQDLDKLATQADRILGTFSSSTSLFVSEVHDEKLESLIERIDALESRSRSSRRSNTKFRSQSRGSISNQRKCWYHFRFGENARKCIPPCNFNERKN